jgi:serine/threonine-protein kinase
MKNYVVFREIAAGSMGTVHLGAVVGSGGFSRLVAVKKMPRGQLGDADLVAMFIDEARLAARVHHRNVVATLDIDLDGGEISVVMEYVHGANLLALLRAAAARGERVPPAVATAIVGDLLYGLHAAHEATTEQGEPLDLVHRDVSPSNVLVGVDGVARVMDFGIAKARGRLHATRDGSIKGKLAYMPPEQLHGEAIDRRVDVYGAGVVLWEALAGEPLFREASAEGTIDRVLRGDVPPPRSLDPSLAVFDDVVLRAVDRAPGNRFETAQAMALALEKVMPRATAIDVGAWVEATAADELAARARVVADVELARAEEPAAPAANVPAHAQASRPRFRRAAAAAIVFLGAAAVFVGLSRKKSDPATLTTRDRAETTAAPEVAPSTPAPADTDPAGPPFSSPGPPRIVDTKRAHTRPRETQPTPARLDCSMPFTVDGNGHKHFRPECVH